ncbi:MAG: glycosyltransferase family 4 protein [Chloroflexi bacterium]|nr:glycosyltransferase family 4 protein [Chloroflexota bacterium]
MARIPGDRYLDLRRHLRDAAIVHSQDLGFWYSKQAAELRRNSGFKLVLTCWETIPFLDSYRNVRTRPYRSITLKETDLFLAATDRARECLLLEGAPSDRIRVLRPGVDQELFAPDERVESEYLIVSPGRLVWEKGHQDAIRAVAALKKGIIPAPSNAVDRVKLLIIGSGPDEQRLSRYASELGIADAVEIRGTIEYREMPKIYQEASAMVLGSLPTWFWEEQYGMVLGEAISSGLHVITTASGAIPEVTGGLVDLVTPGDWARIATDLASGPLSRPPATRVDYPRDLLESLSASRAAVQLAEAYDAVLATG